jgi:hypothetical protein
MAKNTPIVRSKKYDANRIFIIFRLSLYSFGKEALNHLAGLSAGLKKTL